MIVLRRITRLIAVSQMIILAGIAVLAAGHVCADEGAPISQAFLSEQGNPGRKGPGPLKAFFSLLLVGYRRGMSPVDGPTCPFHPTCSGFAGESIRRHGLLQGIVMTGERLIRCNGFDKSDYLRVAPEGRYYDPVP
jgi:putative membrane protein insertion efficiency factor